LDHRKTINLIFSKSYNRKKQEMFVLQYDYRFVLEYDRRCCWINW